MRQSHREDSMGVERQQGRRHGEASTWYQPSLFEGREAACATAQAEKVVDMAKPAEPDLRRARSRKRSRRRPVPATGNGNEP